MPCEVNASNDAAANTNKIMGIPPWALWVFFASLFLIIIFLLLDYLVIRRNALGNTCCAGFRKNAQSKDGTGGGKHSTTHMHKKSTNMVISV